MSVRAIVQGRGSHILEVTNTVFICPNPNCLPSEKVSTVKGKEFASCRSSSFPFWIDTFKREFACQQKGSHKNCQTGRQSVKSPKNNVIRKPNFMLSRR